MCVYRDGADPVQSGEVPGYGAGNGADVHQAGSGRVPEVGQREVEEVQDYEEEGWPEEGAGPEVEEGEEEEVGEDVVAG